VNTTDIASDRVFTEVKRLCHAGLDAATLRQRVLERLKSVVPFERSVAFTMDPSNGLITHALVDEMGMSRDFGSSSSMSVLRTMCWSSTGWCETGCRWGCSRTPQGAISRRPCGIEN